MQKDQTIDKNSFLSKIAFLQQSDKIAAKLYFHYNDGKEDILLEAPTNNESVDKKISKIFSESILSRFNEERNFQILDIQQVEEYDTNATYYYYQSNYPNELKFLFGQKIEKYEFKKHDYSYIKGYYINLNYGNENISLYKYRHNYDIHIKPTLLTLVRIDNELESPSNESIIINEKFDYAVSGNLLIAMSLSTLERKIHFDERVKKQSAEVIQSLRDNSLQIVEGYNKLEEFLNTEFNFAKKLKSIDFNGLLWNTPFKIIKKRIQDKPDLSKYLKFNKGGNKFNITSKKAAKIFLKLCNDKVMESILSGNIHLVDDVESIDAE